MASTLPALESSSQDPGEMRVALEQLKQFRQQLYSSLAYRGDTIMDLLDALSSNTTAKSAVELSLNPHSFLKCQHVQKLDQRHRLCLLLRFFLLSLQW